MKPKPFYRSKTLWFNALTVLIFAAKLFGYTEDQELSSQLSSLWIVLAPFVNIALRLVTKKPIK